MSYLDEFYMYDDSLMHYGTKRHSGRYPWGSGENPYQHTKGFNGYVNDLKRQGLSESVIAQGLGFKSTAELRAHMSIEKDRMRQEQRNQVLKLKDTGMSINAIAKELGIPESTARSIIDPAVAEKVNKTTNVANMLRDQVNAKGYIDIGEGVELSPMVGASSERMKTAVAMLKEEGYKTYNVNVEQVSNPGKYTTIKVLGTPDSTFKDVVSDPTKIKSIDSYVVNDGETILGMVPPKSIDSSRVKIRYAEEGGIQKDGVIELRRGVDDISLGNSMYAQVRIAVDGKNYMKGMAIYSDNMPDGYDVVYNTNKKIGTPPDKVFKQMKTDADGNVDMDNPFGATIKPLNAGGQSYYTDKDGNKQLRVINKVNDQGDWAEWSRTISAQVLSKQPLPLVQNQLDLTYKSKLAEFDEIKSLTNPTIKKKLLESYADDCDASAVHLKAIKFPGQATHVLLPIPSLKDDEVYAPNYENGTQLALIRYPHGGPFEMPILRVNNKNQEALSVMKNAPDAIGVTSKTLARLSGADCDGDTATTIPIPKNSRLHIQNMPALKQLENFDPGKYENEKIPLMKSHRNQVEMGKVTNLIADMQIKGAEPDEIARAVKHSMVVIDSKKHHYDVNQSFIDNGIQELKQKYQNGEGASTLITRSKAEIRVPERKERVDIDPETGKKIYTETGGSYIKTRTLKSGEVRTKEVQRTTTTTRMAEADDARDLMSSKSAPYAVELVYAKYANKMKDLGNSARKEYLNTPALKYSPEAKKKYSKEVDSLNAKLNIALAHSPVERQATILANATVKAKVAANPELKADKSQYKRLRGQAITAARNRLGGKKQRILITDSEWEAIQAGAISDSKLKKILDNTDSDALRKRATPRPSVTLSNSKAAIARSMDANGYSNAEIAEALNISTSSVSKMING